MRRDSGTAYGLALLASLACPFGDAAVDAQATPQDEAGRFGSRTGWLERIVPHTEAIAQTQSLSSTGTIGLLGATRSSDNPLTGSMGSIGTSTIAINDNVTHVQTGYGLYAEARRYAGAGTTQTTEFNGQNGGDTIDVDPYAAPPGLTTDLWLSAGRTDTAMNNPLSLAGGIVYNGAMFRRGLVFFANALDPVWNEAVAMALPYNLAWYAGPARRQTVINGFKQSLRSDDAVYPYAIDMIRARPQGADARPGDVLGLTTYVRISAGQPVRVASAQAYALGASGGVYQVTGRDSAGRDVTLSLHGFGEDSFAPSSPVDLGTAAHRWQSAFVEHLNIGRLAVFADNRAAGAGGLVAGDVYRTADGSLKVVY